MATGGITGIALPEIFRGLCCSLVRSLAANCRTYQRHNSPASAAHARSNAKPSLQSLLQKPLEQDIAPALSRSVTSQVP